MFTRGNDREGYIQTFEGKTIEDVAEKVKVLIHQAEDDGWTLKLAQPTDSTEVKK